MANRWRGIELDAETCHLYEALSDAGVRIIDTRADEFLRDSQGSIERYMGLAPWSLRLTDSVSGLRIDGPSGPRMFARALSVAMRRLREYRRAMTQDEGDPTKGGTILYRPHAIAVDHFGVSVYGLDSTQIVQRFSE